MCEPARPLWKNMKVCATATSYCLLCLVPQTSLVVSLKFTALLWRPRTNLDAKKKKKVKDVEEGESCNVEIESIISTSYK